VAGLRGGRGGTKYVFGGRVVQASRQKKGRRTRKSWLMRKKRKRNISKGRGVLAEVGRKNSKGSKCVQQKTGKCFL